MLRILLTVFIALFSMIPEVHGELSESLPVSDTLHWNKESTEKPWVSNVSKPHTISQGLQNRHLALWASHGRYYDNSKDTWKWQRPYLFGTTEDLYTQTIVLPYLIPMLENAGAIVFTPRERDGQTNEVIVDNDNKTLFPYYIEVKNGKKWKKFHGKGFANPQKEYTDGQNPFEMGTARMAKTASGKKISEINYQPRIPQEGKYAVYVSYQTTDKSIPDAEYIVVHKGVETRFRVNQTMGGGTWVYLGTFDFDEGCNFNNRVVLTNQSARKGIVVADAVRFGGGMGNISRNGKVSGLPRSLEGARYYAQWAGAPYNVYSGKGGKDDYKDDINVRSQMTSWLAGGSAYVPSLSGKKVPIELSLAIHSDAGYEKDGTSLTGSLAICTTNTNNGRLNAGLSRNVSKDFAGLLLQQAQSDIQAAFGHWKTRYLWDRNYSETRLPEVPSAIFETLSHQNFADMRMGQDPNFKFILARSIYKSILKETARLHNTPYVVSPLAPQNFRIEIVGERKIKLSWEMQSDAQEPTAVPTSFNLYTSVDERGFDNGQNVKANSVLLTIEPKHQYNFRVTAVNRGGESFPTPILSAYYVSTNAPTVLVANGFHRLAAPAIIDNETSQGFDFSQDMGVPYQQTNGWSGSQLVFDKKMMGNETSRGLGFSSQEWEGKTFVGNTFDYVKLHTEAISPSQQYNIASCESQTIENGLTNLSPYACVDLILGLEKSDSLALTHYKTFSPALRHQLSAYLDQGGSLLVSGSYIGSDMQTEDEKSFLSHYLKSVYQPQAACPSANIQGLGLQFSIARTIGANTYAVSHPETLTPQADAFCAMTYADGSPAAVAYAGTDYKTFSMGFPFESITDKRLRQQILSGVLKFLIKP